MMIDAFYACTYGSVSRYLKKKHTKLIIYIFFIFEYSKENKNMIGNSKVGYGSTLLGTPYSIIYIHKQSKMNVANKKKGLRIVILSLGAQVSVYRYVLK